MCRMHMMKLPPVENSDEDASCKLNLVVQLYREYVHSFLNEQLTIDDTIFTVECCYKPTMQTLFLPSVYLFKQTDYTNLLVPWVAIVNRDSTKAFKPLLIALPSCRNSYFYYVEMQSIPKSYEYKVLN